MSAADLSTQDRLALHELVAALWERTDRAVDAHAEDLFVEGAEMRIGTLVKTGLNEIIAYNVDRRAQEDASGRRTRHAASNLIAELESDGRARLRFLCVVFAGTGEQPFPSSVPSNIADFSATCERGEDGRWRFTGLYAKAIFFGPAAPANAR
ncbi:MAG: nuclear transport factor 2 family protein [Hyphomonadaceae bacterium]